MKKLFFVILLAVLFFAAPAFAAWTANSAKIVDYGNHINIVISLNSDGSAVSDFDVYAQISSSLSISEAQKIGGGLLYGVGWYQGATWNGSSDFAVTVYNGNSLSIFAATFDYDEAGSGTVVGGYYSGATSEGTYASLDGGLIIDVGDIGDSGDDITLIFVILF